MAINKVSPVNPAPIGLFGFAASTWLLNLKNAGFIDHDSIIWSTGLIVGGITQMLAGVLEFFAHSQFTCVVFTLYGSFWISLVYVNDTMGGSNDGPFACYCFIWGLLTLFMAIATFAPGMHLFSKLVFCSVTVLLFMLSLIHGMLAHNPDASVHVLETIAGVIGIFAGCAAFWEGMAGVLNSDALYGRELLPLGPRTPRLKTVDVTLDAVPETEASSAALVADVESERERERQERERQERERRNKEEQNRREAAALEQERATCLAAHATVIDRVVERVTAGFTDMLERLIVPRLDAIDCRLEGQEAAVQELKTQLGQAVNSPLHTEDPSVGPPAKRGR
ncbi:GPR1/FUN34/yaaH family protein [Kipferlia bialata]|uniref:GPR1/FUN34/yaaH family protein n=1 Tax=Kipferlia bialata TaxID=797122 RepID=A0A9K3CPZ7_9EUKA|nr:GPR1/FUN34/yaaH family protein [Kipferlia bialata]|eukprot:g987.t1